MSESERPRCAHCDEYLDLGEIRQSNSVECDHDKLAVKVYCDVCEEMTMLTVDVNWKTQEARFSSLRLEPKEHKWVLMYRLPNTDGWHHVGETTSSSSDGLVSKVVEGKENMPDEQKQDLIAFLREEHVEIRVVQVADAPEDGYVDYHL